MAVESPEDRGTVSLALDRLNGDRLALEVARPEANDSASHDFPRLAGAPNAPGNIEIGLRCDIGNDRPRPRAAIRSLILSTHQRLISRDFTFV